MGTANPSGSSGTFTTNFRVPRLAAGRYPVRVGSISVGDFTITSLFTVSPSSGPPGTNVTVQGTGFSPNSPVSLTIGGSSWQSLTADEDGELTGTLQIPQLSGGAKTITASGGGGSATFNVTPSLALSRPTAFPGDTVNISGAGFGAFEIGITVTFDGRTFAGGITADAQGSWSMTFTVPPTTDGDHRVSAASNLTPEVPDVRLTVVAIIAADSVSLYQDPVDGATGFTIGIDRVIDHRDGLDAQVFLGAFQVEMTYDGRCVNIVGIRQMDFTVAAIHIDNNSGKAIFNGFAAAGTSVPADLGHALTRLVGNARQNCTVKMEVVDLIDRDGNSVGVSPFTLSLEVLRGDARSDGSVDIADFMFIAQYLSGSRPACKAKVDTNCLHSVNAASVRRDGSFDQVLTADALLIAQYLVGLRDEFYSLVR